MQRFVINNNKTIPQFAGFLIEKNEFILYRISQDSKGYKMDEKKLSFEEAYKQLMELVNKMESGQLPLADSVAAYEQGVKLKAYCEQLLKEAELKIETLKVSA